ncbi:MerR family DNA-binding transcriptional regulator [Bacillus salitolerans]|uniref:MerR family DNA-binding transcriptional regulator n=1 Tax=Bacillus salitolerans TaxID=1437434 RepID=A0ABW4LYN4_9BACI
MYSISDMAKEFKVTTRTIRYYEELGLLKPLRSEAGRRVFTSKDYARLKLIVRGKRFGFTLDEIKEMVLLFDVDPTGKKQLERTIDYGNQRIKEVNERIEELMEMKQEMELLRNDFLKRLNHLKGEKKL